MKINSKLDSLRQLKEVCNMHAQLKDVRGQGLKQMFFAGYYVHLDGTFCGMRLP